MEASLLIKLDSKQIKKIELNILNQFDLFCKEHNIQYYLSGGTLLGAVRHKGFIPWDDDIDVCLSRKDYDWLVHNFTCPSGYLTMQSMKLNNFEAPFSKLVDNRTIVKQMYAKSDMNGHLWIDIFPVDGLPENLAEVKCIYSKCDFYRRILLLADARIGEGKTTFRKYGKYILKPLANLYGKKRCAEKIEIIARKHSYEDCDYVGAITWGIYGVGERMRKEEFERVVKVEFEGRIFDTFSCWDSYLKGLYGNYMKLPPVGKRKTHDMDVWLRGR